MSLSYWEHQTFFKNQDLVIIGSGIVGLSTALYAKKINSKLNITILERGYLPSGASTKNAGFACFGSITEINDDLKNQSEEQVFSLIERRWKGLQNLRKLLGDEGIGFEQNGGYDVFDNEKEYKESHEKIDYLNKQLKSIFKDAQVFKTANDKIKRFGFGNTKHLILNKFEGQIDSGLMMKSLIDKALKSGIKIFNGIKIEKLNNVGNTVELVTSEGDIITAKKVLIATNGFAKQLLPELNVAPGRGQVIVTSPIKNLKIKGAFHYQKGYFYFRNVGNRILLGGGRNLNFKAEETTEFGETKLVQNKLNELLTNVILPNSDFKIEYKWSGIMGFGDDKSPIVKPLSKNVYCAVKMGGMGVAIGSLVGHEAARMVLE